MLIILKIVKVFLELLACVTGVCMVRGRVYVLMFKF